MQTEKLDIQCTIVEYKTIVENFGSRKITEILLSAIPKKAAEQSVHWTAYLVLGLGVFVLGAVFGFWLAGI